MAFLRTQIKFARTRFAGLLAAFVLQGCVAESVTDSDTRQDNILDFYMPRTTESRYLYKYAGFYSGKRDSLYYVDYRGIASVQNSHSTDGKAPIHQYAVSSTDGKSSTDIDLYVSDSMVIEYGVDCASTSERFIPLKQKLRVGESWVAAYAYQATKDYQISYIAKVEAHYDRLMVADSVIYHDVWQVRYDVTGTPTNTTPAKEYLPKARRVVYYARGIGKIFELAFSPDNVAQWQSELLRIDRR